MDNHNPPDLTTAVKETLLAWDNNQDLALKINQLRCSLAQHHMRTFIHRYFVHQANVFPHQEVENAKTLNDVLTATQNDPNITQIEERVFEWVATKNYDRMGKPTQD
jgi:hypothetical protein